MNSPTILTESTKNTIADRINKIKTVDSDGRVIHVTAALREAILETIFNGKITVQGVTEAMSAPDLGLFMKRNQKNADAPLIVLVVQYVIQEIGSSEFTDPVRDMSLVDRLSLAVEEGITLTHEDTAYTLNSNNKVYPTTAFVSALTELMDEDITSANLHSVWDNARTVRRIVNKLTDAETIEFLTRNRDIRLMYDRVYDMIVDNEGIGYHWFVTEIVDVILDALVQEILY